MAFEVVVISIVAIMLLVFIIFSCRNKKSKAGTSTAADDTASDDDDNGNDNSGSPTVAEKTRTVNSKGLEILSNGVVSLRALDLAHQVPTKSRDDGALKLCNVSLTLSKAYTLLCFVHCGKHMPVEKHRDEAARLILLQSAAKYSLNAESLMKIMGSGADQRSAFIVGLAKNAQQVIRYSLYGQTINFICDKVLTPRDVHPSDEIKTHLGLTGENARKSFMDV